MKKTAQNEKNVRPKRSAACRIQTYSLLQSGYYNEQRDLKRALKCSLIEAKAAQIKQKNLDSKRKQGSSAKKIRSNGLVKNDKINKLNDKTILDKKVIQTTDDKDNSQDSKPLSNDKTKNDEKIVFKRFTAHRKFAQNCLPFSTNSIPVEFKEKESTTTNKLSNQFKQPTPPVVPNDLFENVTTNEFLTFLCFRDYVSLPISLDKEMNTENDDSSKFETRKENTDLVSTSANKESKNELFKENSKKIKLNGNKIKQEVTVKEENKISQTKLNPNKVNGKSTTKINGKLNGNSKIIHNKLNSPSKLNQLKTSSTKINQIKSNKLAKLAKLNKVKLEEKKKINDPRESDLKSNGKITKKKVDNEAFEPARTINDKQLNTESIKNLINKPTKKKYQTKSTNTESITKSDKSSKLNIKKEKVKKKIMNNTRQLRGGRFHNYQAKF